MTPDPRRLFAARHLSGKGLPPTASSDQARADGASAASPLAITGGPFLLLVVVALFALNLALHYPGTMSNDSNDQYEQAVAGVFTDWHPPVMAWLWSLLRVVWEGPAPFLLLHLAVSWAGWGLMADSLRRAGHPGCALLMALAGAFPPFLDINANVVKDVGMVSSWVGAIGLILWFRTQGRRVPLLAGLLITVLILYGTMVRTNAVFGLGPLLVYAVAPVSWLRNWRLMAAAVVVAVAAIPVSQVVNQRLFNPQPTNPAHSLFLFDLAGIAAHERDASLAAPPISISNEQLQTCYTPYWWDSFSPWGRCASRVDRPEGSRGGPEEGLPSQWARTVVGHPLAYLTHRLKHFNSSLLFAVPLKHSRLAPEFRQDDPAFPPIKAHSERDIKLDLLMKNPLVWPVTWLVWGAFLLVYLARQEPVATTQVARVLIVSALGYSCAYLVIGVATDLRYHYWSIAAVLAATVLVLPQWTRGLRSRSMPLVAGVAAVALVVATGIATRLLDVTSLVT